MSFVKVKAVELLHGGRVSEHSTELLINPTFVKVIVGKSVYTTEGEQGLSFTVDKRQYVRLEFISFEG